MHDGRGRPVDPFVHFLLPPVGRDSLAEISLRVHEADADERHAEVARLLAVVAGEHAQAACVNRQRLVKRELGTEIGDHLLAVVIDVPLPPVPSRTDTGRT